MDTYIISFVNIYFSRREMSVSVASILIFFLGEGTGASLITERRVTIGVYDVRKTGEVIGHSAT
jgi:predicted NBD/HSP70 family sugar kinase